MTTRRFELVEDKSSKFWEVDQQGTDLHIRWGRIGTAGQSQTKVFAEEAKAAAALGKLVVEKTRKGYQETEGQTVAAPAPTSTSTLPPKHKLHSPHTQRHPSMKA